MRLPSRTKLKMNILKSLTRKSIALLIAFSFLFSGFNFEINRAFASGTGEFRVSNYGSGQQQGNWWYRGYRFQVSQETVVTHLIGGGTGATFNVGLYTMTFNGSKYVPTQLLGTVAATGSTPEQVIQLADPVTLVPNTDYILAQGGASASGSHFYVSTLNVQDLLDGSPRINFWEPTVNSSIRWNGGGAASSIVGVNHEDFNGAMPLLGFQYLTDVTLPAVTTQSQSINGNEITLSGNLISAGNGVTINYIEVGTASNLSNGVLYIAGETEEDNSDFSVNFTPNPGTLYYYRAVAINEAGRTNGSIQSFRVYSVTYNAGANGEIQGTSSQLLFPGEDTSSVTAVPTTAGYVFDGWSDGNTDNPRLHTNVNSNITVTANFVIPPVYNLEYSATSGGSVVGDLSQIIDPGEDGTTVTAVVDPGYYFAGWSDDVETLERTDINVMNNINAVAQFGLITEISNVSVLPSNNSASVSWNTNALNSSRIRYGLTSSLLIQTAESNTSPRVESHSVPLSNLVPCSRYFYRVLSRDQYDTLTQSGIVNFMTSGCEVSILTGEGQENTADVLTGGVVEFDSPAAKAKLVIPDGYSSTTASFQINKLDKSAINNIPEGMQILGESVFNLVAKDEDTSEQLTDFDQPISFSISYDNNIAQGIDTGTLEIRRYNSGTEEWDLLVCDHNASLKTITCELDSFSIYGAFGAPAPAGQVLGSRVSSSGSSLEGRVSALVSLNKINEATVLAQEFNRNDLVSKLISVASSSTISNSELVCVPFLRRGSRGERVRQMQERLGAVAIDGIFGPQTYSAVRDFQASKGIRVDGIAGPETCSML
jgi:uncharacterized repeat protein (TIGR02543 family)